MIYSPHILQVKVSTDIQEDEYGRPVAKTDSWKDVCSCRCDDNSTKEFRTENGEVFRPVYHVVCVRTDLKAGDEIRCMDGETVRGEGRIYMVKNSNYFNYSEIWL